MVGFFEQSVIESTQRPVSALETTVVEDMALQDTSLRFLDLNYKSIKLLFLYSCMKQGKNRNCPLLK